VEDARNLDCVRLDLIDNDVGQRCESEFTPPGDSAADSAKIGKILKTGALIINCEGNASGGFGVVPFNPLADLLQICEWSSAAGMDQRTCIRTAKTVGGGGRLAHG